MSERAGPPSRRPVPADPEDVPMPPGLMPAQRVLIIDPDPLFARIAKAKLEKWGYAPQIETSGTAAYEWLRAESFRLVVMELDLPGMGAAELCRRIRELRRPYYTYVVVYTGRKDKSGLVTVLEAGIDDYLVKPFDALEFRLRLKNAERLLALDEELHHGSGTDRATGLINRGTFLQFFRIIIADCVRHSTSGTLLFIEITNFADAFRRHGYEAAQMLQAKVAEALSTTLRDSDLFACTGDGEFCLMLHNRSPDTVCPVADIILRRVGPLTVEYEDTRMHPVLRCSIVGYPQDGLSAEDILADEGRALCHTAFPEEGAPVV
ncbi:MAG: response regulator [Alphaproteobacteria bacterium]